MMHSSDAAAKHSSDAKKKKRSDSFFLVLAERDTSAAAYDSVIRANVAHCSGGLPRRFSLEGGTLL